MDGHVEINERIILYEKKKISICKSYELVNVQQISLVNTYP